MNEELKSAYAHYVRQKAGSNQMAEFIRAAKEQAWEEGHNHCFHVENPHNKERNPYTKKEVTK